ncbi:MAG: DUF1700 domain-containing protein [Roseburia sp.]
MNREEFLRQLERLLSGISEEERVDAIAFYRSYFEEAGEENEDAVIEELGSPQKVAEIIRKNLGIDGSSGYCNTFANRDAEYYKNVNDTIRNLGGNRKKHQTGVAVGIGIAVLTSPLWIALLLAAGLTAFAVVVTLFALAISIVAVMASLLFVGVIVFGIGISMLFGGESAVGLGLMGGGLLVLAVGILSVLLAIWVFGVFLPWALKGLWNLCKKPFQHRKERAVV